MSKIRVEFLSAVDRTNHVTQIYVWSNHTADARLVDRLEMPEKLSQYQKKKIREELEEKYKDEE